jgi:predicted metal-dependent HD superfamily phosphohydrolase
MPSVNHIAARKYILGRLEAELAPGLTYHCYEHTLQVMDSAQKIAMMEGIDPQAMDLLVTAAAYHDSGFLTTYKNHEEVGCQLVAEILPQFGFDAESIRRIQSMIMATKVPQKAQSHLEEIICDADLEYLGGQEYESIADRLLHEMRIHGFLMDEVQWIDLQINFLNQHHFWTRTVIERCNGPKRKVLSRLIAKRA